MNEVILYLGQICNNNCIMCSVKGDDRYAVDYKKLIKKMEQNREMTDKISFTGGEPTEHPDIIKLFKKANELDYKKISLSSNGVNLANKRFTQKLIELGLQEASIAIHGPKKIHNEITQNTNYEKCIKALKILLKNNIKLTVDSVLIKPNKDHLKELWKDMHELGIEFIGLVDLVPEGGENTNFDKLMLSYTEKKNFFYDNIEILKKFKIFRFVNAPRCVLPAKLPENFFHTSNYEKEANWKFDGLDNKGTKYLKEKINFCEKCPYNNRCFGFRTKYLNKFGKDNVREMWNIDNFREVNQE